MKNPQTTPDLFRSKREEWINGARAAARNLLRHRQKITIEDVLAVYPRPKYLHRNTTGTVFHDTMFKSIGYTLAKNPSSHKRVIRYWALNPDAISKGGGNA